MLSISSKLPQVGTTIFSQISALALQHNAINLGQGFADYAMDANLCNMVQEAMLQNHNQYAPMPGVPALRQLIASKVNGLYNKATDWETEITVTPGGTYAMYTAIATIVNKGDEVIVLEPAYDSYIPNIVLQGGIPICVPLQMPSGAVDWNLVQAAISTRTKAIVVNTPNNPCGYTFSKDDWSTLAALLQDTNIFVISDEVYEHIVMDQQPHNSILNQPQLWERCFAVFSFGKVFHNTGWKLGYCIAPSSSMAEFRKVHQYLAFTCNTPMQVAIAKYLQEPSHYLQLPMFFQQKRDLFLQAMQNTDFTLYEPAKGSFFQTMGYHKISHLPDGEFATWLTTKHGVACIPVSSFYQQAQQHGLVRFCFAKKEETLLAAAEKLSQVPSL
jgi:methionine transaminase